MPLRRRRKGSPQIVSLCGSGRTATGLPESREAASQRKMVLLQTVASPRGDVCSPRPGEGREGRRAGRRCGVRPALPQASCAQTQHRRARSPVPPDARSPCCLHRQAGTSPRSPRAPEPPKPSRTLQPPRTRAPGRKKKSSRFTKRALPKPQPLGKRWGRQAPVSPTGTAVAKLGLAEAVSPSQCAHVCPEL